MNWGFTEPGLYEVDLRIMTIARCDTALTADVAPLLEGVYAGDCLVDFQDVLLLAQHWLDYGCGSEPDICQGTDLFDSADGTVNLLDLAVLAGQWLDCGYPGCERADPSTP
jgi:hypothetical protein